MSTATITEPARPSCPSRPRPMRRLWAFRCLALAIPLLLGASALEVAVRVLGLGSDLLHRPDPYVGHCLIAGARGKFNSPGDGGARQIAINSLGLRDRETTLAKPPGTRRVLILGDSYCEALQVEEVETFQAVLERHWNLDTASPEIEVVNTGVSGYGADNELLTYRHLGQKLEPDVVVLSFFTNDLEDCSVELQHRFGGVEQEPYFTLDAGRLVLHDYPYDHKLSAVNQFLKQHVRSYRIAWQRLDNALRSRQVAEAGGGLPGQFQLHFVEDDAQHAAAWRLHQALTRQIRDEVEADGVKFLLLLCTCSWQVHPEHLQWFEANYPAIAEHEWDWPRPQRVMEQFAAEQGMPCLNLLPSFAQHAEATGEELHFRGGHWNAAGHQLAARQLRQFIDQQFPGWRKAETDARTE